MADCFTKAQRSLVMSKIRSRNTRLEERCFSLLREAGIRFRKYPRGIYGNPDAANKTKRLAIFVDGDFWHGYRWNKRKNAIGTNRKYWTKKIERNIERDKEVNRMLRRLGWKVVRVWGFQLGPKRRKKTLRKLNNIASLL